MKLSTAKRRINKTLDELCKSVVDDWYANFKNGYIKGYEDARQGKSPMYAEAYKVADTPQTDCETCKYGQDKHRYAHICNECGVGINNYTPQTDCGWGKPTTVSHSKDKED